MPDDEADAFVDAIARDWRTASLNAVDGALCAYAEKLTLAPADMGESDVEALRAAGLDDVAIHGRDADHRILQLHQSRSRRLGRAARGIRPPLGRRVGACQFQAPALMLELASNASRELATISHSPFIFIRHTDRRGNKRFNAAF